MFSWPKSLLPELLMSIAPQRPFEKTWECKRLIAYVALPRPSNMSILPWWHIIKNLPMVIPPTGSLP
ncbi:hypothetical protein LIER_32852 [Lithospermum erythrorhizon]